MISVTLLSCGEPLQNAGILRGLHFRGERLIDRALRQLISQIAAPTADLCGCWLRSLGIQALGWRVFVRGGVGRRRRCGTHGHQFRKTFDAGAGQKVMPPLILRKSLLVVWKRPGDHLVEDLPRGRNARAVRMHQEHRRIQNTAAGTGVRVAGASGTGACAGAEQGNGG